MWADPRSLKVYLELHSDLQKLVDRVHDAIEIKLLCGYRGEDDQKAAFLTYKSDKEWPDSKHNKLPSLAVDWTPLPINWAKEKFIYVAGLFVMAAHDLAIKTRWGGNWDMDADILEIGESDLGHIELI